MALIRARSSRAENGLAMKSSAPVSSPSSRSISSSRAVIITTYASLMSRIRRQASMPSMPGQAEVEGDQVGLVLAHRLDGRQPGVHRDHLEALGRQCVLEQLADVLVVLDDECAPLDARLVRHSSE